jgi:5-methylcytosine-specific restriction endonuclease McrA
MTVKRPCLSCGVLAAGSRCPSWVRAKDCERGTVTDRFGPGWARISRQVIARDEGICHICGEPGADTADHLLPRSLGGDSADMGLLAAAHRACNSRRGAPGAAA